MNSPKRGSPPAAAPTDLDRSAGGLPPEGQTTGDKVSAEHPSNSRRGASFRSENDAAARRDRAQSCRPRSLFPKRKPRHPRRGFHIAFLSYRLGLAAALPARGSANRSRNSLSRPSDSRRKKIAGTGHALPAFPQATSMVLRVFGEARVACFRPPPHAARA